MLLIRLARRNGTDRVASFFFRPKIWHGYAAIASVSSWNPPVCNNYCQQFKTLSAQYATSSVVTNETEVARTSRDGRFQLLRHPQILLPSFDISRRLANFYSQMYYSLRHEKEFSQQGFLRGVEEGVALASDYIVNETWKSLQHLTQPGLVNELRELRSALTPRDVNLLRFKLDDVVSSFVFSSMIRKEWTIRQALKTSRSIFINDAVVFVLKGEKDWLLKNRRPSPARLLAEQKQNLLVCNVQFSRVIHPVLAGWRITSLNFFEPP